MSKGFSLHIGVNHTDSAHYGGLSSLGAAVNDAIFWNEFASGLGYRTKSLHDDEARTENVLAQLQQYASVMQAEDIFLLTYSGHGGQLPNLKPDHVDKEKMDQTWCLYNRQLLDDEIYEALKAFPEGCRILIISDSCHSGTVARAAEIDLSDLLVKGMDLANASRGFRSRQVPDEVEFEILARHYDEIYEPLQKRFENTPKVKGVQAAVKLLAACQDHQVTYDGDHLGLFTESLKDLITQSSASYTAQQLVDEVRRKYSFPRPNFFEYGSIIPSFDVSFPFSIEIPNAGITAGYREPVLHPGNMPRSTEDAFTTPDIDRGAQLTITINGQVNETLAGGAEVDVLEERSTDGGKELLVELPAIPFTQGWRAAHAMQVKLDALGIDAKVEPVLSFNPNDQFLQSRAADENNQDYMPEWPPSDANPPVKIGWHLDDQHSQLAKAAATVAANPAARVKIGHLDTGYIEGHPALPEKLDKYNGRSFVNKEPVNPAVDKPQSGMDGHGLGTVCLLAGGKVTKEQTFGDYEGYIGGAYMADVLPLRISESVIIFNSRNFCDALDYAVAQGCEVVSMSMAGKPDKAMARAINRAYEAGLVIVTAASNCWYKGPMRALPKCVLFPAAFERVIAATGAMYNYKPYDQDFLLSARMDFTKYMQGCWGPESRMSRALAAYTPNTPWASKKVPFLRSGGGTSSATPQVAAGAALYIAHHRAEMEALGYYQPGRQWMKVEAVRHALFSSAAKAEAFPDFRKYYGNGILRAYNALQVPVATEDMIEKAPDAESGIGGIFEIVGSFFKNRKLFRSDSPRPSEEALAAELLHLMQTDPAFYDDFAGLDLGDKDAVAALVEGSSFIEKVLQSAYASEFLKEAITA